MEATERAVPALGEGESIAFARMFTPAVFSVMRTLKAKNPGDTYYECYLGHLQKAGPDFFDQYNVAWWYGSQFAPRRVLEVGTRTGISLCQLLGSYFDLSKLERAVTVDPYVDGYSNAGIVRMNLRALNIPMDKIEIVDGRSEVVLPRLIQEKAEFDYILVDGDHAKAAALRDLEFAEKLCATGGVIVFDDISPDGCDLLDVWDEWRLAVYARSPGVAWRFYHDLNGKGTAWAVKGRVGS